MCSGTETRTERGRSRKRRGLAVAVGLEVRDTRKARKTRRREVIEMIETVGRLLTKLRRKPKTEIFDTQTLIVAGLLTIFIIFNSKIL